VTTDDQRDAEMDQLLRATLTPTLHGRSEACPDAALLAAFEESSLSESERAGLESHFAICHRCQEALASFARTAPLATEPVAARRSWLRTGHLRWLIPVVAASGLVLYIAARPVVAPSFLPVPSAPQASRDSSVASVTDQLAVNRTPEPASGTVLSQPSGQASGGGVAAPAAVPVESAKPASPLPAFAATDRTAAADRARDAKSTSEIIDPSAPAPAAVRADTESRLAANMGGGQPPRPQVGAGVEAPQQKPQGGVPAEAVSPTTPSQVPSGRVPTNAAAGLAPVTPAAAPGGREMAMVQGTDAVGEARAASVRKMAFKEPVLPFVIASPGTETRWRLEPGGGISRSTDAGANWRRQLPAGSTELFAASSPSSVVCWAAGRAGVVLLTVDGERWQPRPFPFRIDLVAVEASSPLDASVVARDGRRFITADGGATWVVGR
jgi:hypothetical protein